jgi:ABC-type uncharacterized transport system ATPase component|tara:strand:+ start:287 stop:598 length:312 start_codon:yes stop_codon:yes gene_type:complete
MKNLLAIISLVALTNCSLPLVGSVGTSSVTGVVTGKYTHSAATTVIDIATYEKTGKTTKQHLYSKIFQKEKETPKTVLMYDDFKQKTYARLSSHQYYNEILAP